MLLPPPIHRRLVQLYVGLVLYGLSMALMIRAGLGLDPWDVFHQGLAGRTGLSFGTIVNLTGAIVLLLWVPLRQRPGIGTVSNILVIGTAADIGLHFIPDIAGLPWQALALGVSIVGNGLAGGLYIGAGLGPGPRDGLMTGVVRRMGWSIRLTRTGIEVIVLATGWALGGTIGLGTVIYALAIGPLVQLFLPLCTIPAPKAAALTAK